MFSRVQCFPDFTPVPHHAAAVGPDDGTLREINEQKA